MDMDKITRVWPAAAVGAIIGLFGGCDTMLIVLAAFMVIDYVTGILSGLLGKSAKTPGGYISSAVAWTGLVKKLGELIAVIVGVLLDSLATEQLGLSGAVFRTGIMLYIIATEGISILENLGAIGVPLPAFVKKALEQLQAASDDQESPNIPSSTE